ncbi:MAG: mannose-1-phosphate guanylyltransferase [Balneolaceae bacterium]
MIYAVIMAGGSGTRFWPRSTQENPKQFLKLFGDRTMIQSTVDRLKGFIPEERSMVVTNERYVEKVGAQLPGIPPSFVIGEPVARNTAPCIAAAAQILFNKDPGAVMVVLPADHHVLNDATFRSLLAGATETAIEEQSLVTVGIRPDRPETGYGYIRYNRSAQVKAGSHEAYEVKNFTEKPGRDEAMAFLESGDYLWNSGMFIWKAETILEAFRLYQPDIYDKLGYLKSEKVTQDDLTRFYTSCPSISVDYGIMEKASKVHVLPGDFGWSDVGSWKTVYTLAEKNGLSNCISASKTSVQNSRGNLIHSESNKIISLVGVENMAVVETEDAILVCNLDHSQDVKKVVEHLKGRPDLKKYL